MTIITQLNLLGCQQLGAGLEFDYVETFGPLPPGTCRYRVLYNGDPNVLYDQDLTVAPAPVPTIGPWAAFFCLVTLSVIAAWRLMP